jgi:hypothetical protein
MTAVQRGSPAIEPIKLPTSHNSKNPQRALA